MTQEVFKYYFCMYDDSNDTKWSVQPRAFVIDTTDIFTCKFLQDSWFNYSVSGANYQEKLGEIQSLNEMPDMMKDLITALKQISPKKYQQDYGM